MGQELLRRIIGRARLEAIEGHLGGILGASGRHLGGIWRQMRDTLEAGGN
jgi:hypothetical protein